MQISERIYCPWMVCTVWLCLAIGSHVMAKGILRFHNGTSHPHPADFYHELNVALLQTILPDPKIKLERKRAALIELKKAALEGNIPKNWYPNYITAVISAMESSSPQLQAPLFEVLSEAFYLQSMSVKAFERLDSRNADFEKIDGVAVVLKRQAEKNAPGRASAIFFLLQMDHQHIDKEKLLRQALQSTKPQVRLRALQATANEMEDLSQVGRLPAKTKLETLKALRAQAATFFLEREHRSDERWEAARALVCYGKRPGAIRTESLLQLAQLIKIGRGETEVRHILRILATHLQFHDPKGTQEPNILKAITQTLSEPRYPLVIRRAAAEHLTRLRLEGRPFADLVEFLVSDDPKIRKSIYEVLENGKIQGYSYIQFQLTKLLKQPQTLQVTRKRILTLLGSNTVISGWAYIHLLEFRDSQETKFPGLERVIRQIQQGSQLNFTDDHQRDRGRDRFISRITANASPADLVAGLHGLRLIGGADRDMLIRIAELAYTATDPNVRETANATLTAHLNRNEVRIGTIAAICHERNSYHELARADQRYRETILSGLNSNDSTSIALASELLMQMDTQEGLLALARRLGSLPRTRTSQSLRAILVRDIIACSPQHATVEVLIILQSVVTDFRIPSEFAPVLEFMEQVPREIRESYYARAEAGNFERMLLDFQRGSINVEQRLLCNRLMEQVRNSYSDN